jgi:hypothetical protein
VSDFFKNLDAIRLSPESQSLIAASEVLTHVPVRKPNRTDFFRVHPDPDMSFATAVYVDSEERETYLLSPNVPFEIMGEAKPVNLTLAVTRYGHPFLWAVPFPDQLGRSNPWTDTAREAANLAVKSWVRMVSDMQLRAYRIFKAEGQLSDPIWPEKSLSELLELAFKDRVIDSPDHPLVRRLRGLV